MKYINRTTREVIFHYDLCQRLNAVIVQGDIVGEWEPVQLVEPPPASEGFHIIMGPIALDPATDTFVHTYVEEANTPLPLGVPVTIDAFQGKAALIHAGLYAYVNNYINDPTTPEIYRVAWNSAKSWERDSPFVNNMLALMEKTPEEGDALFILADGISLNNMLES